MIRDRRTSAKQPKERIIYSNYELWNEYAKSIIEDLINDGDYLIEDDVPEDRVWDLISIHDEMRWNDEEYDLIDFFKGGKWILQGNVGTWLGNRKGGFVFDTFEEMWNKATRDCDYFKIYDVNGHFYMECSHHDGTNHYEIKKLTERGNTMFENWENSWSDSRTEREIHDKIMSNSVYATLPNYMHEVYGCPKRQCEII